jgi:hypothetical protein
MNAPQQLIGHVAAEASHGTSSAAEKQVTV